MGRAASRVERWVGHTGALIGETAHDSRFYTPRVDSTERQRDVRRRNARRLSNLVANGLAWCCSDQELGRLEVVLEEPTATETTS